MTCFQNNQFSESQYLALFKVELLKASHHMHPQPQISCSLVFEVADFAGGVFQQILSRELKYVDILYHHSAVINWSISTTH